MCRLLVLAFATKVCLGQNLDAYGSVVAPRQQELEALCNHYFQDGNTCDWTLDYYCPGQSPGQYSKGPATNDGSEGYNCCCEAGAWDQARVVTMQTPLKATATSELNGLCRQYLSDYSACDWTQDHNCPGQQPGRKGMANNDGTEGYKCCCEAGGWNQMNSAGQALGTPYTMDCPIMSDLGSGATLQLEPWSFWRQVNILPQAAGGPLFTDGGGLNTQIAESSQSTRPMAGGANAMAAANGFEDDLEDPVGGYGTQPTLGHVRYNPLAWTSTYVLYGPFTGKEITRIVNPSPLAFWDHTEMIYDCRGDMMGYLTWKFDFAALFSTRWQTHQVHDAQGNYIAQVIQEKLTEGYALGTQQFVYLADRFGSPLASMRHPSGGWNAGAAGEYFNVDLKIFSQNSVVPPPAMNPEFMVLIFAEALAGDRIFGPYCAMIVWPLLLILCICGGGGCWMRSRPAPAPEMPKSAEETKSLINTEVGNAKDAGSRAGSSIWNCCSRAAPVAASDKPKPAHH